MSHEVKGPPPAHSSGKSQHGVTHEQVPFVLFSCSRNALTASFSHFFLLQPLLTPSETDPIRFPTPAPTSAPTSVPTSAPTAAPNVLLGLPARCPRPSHQVPPQLRPSAAFVSSSPLPSFVPSSRVACDQIKSRRARARAALLVLRGLVPVSLVFPVPFALAWSLSLLRFPPSEPLQHQARSPWARPPPPCSLVRTCAFPVAARRVLRWLLRSLCVACN